MTGLLWKPPKRPRSRRAEGISRLPPSAEAWTSYGGEYLESRIDRLIEELAAKRANLGVTSGRQAVEEAAGPLETRSIVVLERGRFRDLTLPERPP